MATKPSGSSEALAELRPFVELMRATLEHFAHEMRRTGRAFKFVSVLATGDYASTGVAPFGGPWTRWQVKSDV